MRTKCRRRAQRWHRCRPPLTQRPLIATLQIIILRHPFIAPRKTCRSIVRSLQLANEQRHYNAHYKRATSKMQKQIIPRVGRYHAAPSRTERSRRQPALALMKINLVNDVGVRRCRSVPLERGCATLPPRSLFLILS